MFWWSLTGQPNDVQHFMLQHSAVCNKSENRMRANRSACICQFWLGWILRQRWSEYVTSLTTSSVSQQWSVVFCLVKPTDTQALRLVNNLSKRVSHLTPARDLLDLMSTTSRDTYRALHYSFRLVGIEKQDKIDRFDRSNSCHAALPRGYAHTQTHACTHAYARRPNRPYSYHINHLLNKGNDS